MVEKVGIGAYFQRSTTDDGGVRERERGRERDRAKERNVEWCVCVMRTPAAWVWVWPRGGWLVLMDGAMAVAPRREARGERRAVRGEG